MTTQLNNPTESAAMLWCLKDLLAAYDNGWLNYSWPEGTAGKQWAHAALQAARDTVRAVEGQPVSVYLINGDLTSLL